MKMKYVAIDGTEFEDRELCERHEKLLAKKEYAEKFIDGSLAVRASKMISIYKSYCNARSMSNEFLEEEGAVDILVARIAQLEEKNKRLIDQFPRK